MAERPADREHATAHENRLGRETSPYLLQHKSNPVDWWPWGPQALAEAKRANKPILLSIGYAACHWCHVMAHESFEDPATAALMNELYINIKVDREERPDIDAIYMGALHRLGEHGGWPLTMFLDPDARPFWGGTYFPPESRWGKPSFRHVLREVHRIWRDEPDKVAHNATALVDSLKTKPRPDLTVELSDAGIAGLVERMTGAIDPEHGGISGAPKFPQWSFFWLLWRGAIRYGSRAARDAVERTLVHICQGGIYDHLGGGFARYSVDERWLVPHFEKMLYDNALLIDLMTEVWRETSNPLLEARIAETVSWLEREMLAGDGFAASLDADSEGEEGRFYVWTHHQIASVLGEEDARTFASHYDVPPGGNWEGHTILNRLSSLAMLSETEEQRLGDMRRRLLEARATRIRPGWDDKVLADWNGLMIAALANASAAFRRPEWLSLAERAFAFVVDKLSIEGGRLRHSWRDGSTRADATASDYADMTWAAIRLHATTGNPAYLDHARRWTATLDRHFWITEAGGYAMTADDATDAIVRLRPGHDDATPNANAISITNLVHLHLLTGEAAYLERAREIPDAFASDLQHSTLGHCGLLANTLDVMSPLEVVILAPPGTSPEALTLVLQHISLPGALTCVRSDSAATPATSPLAGKTSQGGMPTAYVCAGQTCSPPVTDPQDFTTQIREARRADSS